MYQCGNGLKGVRLDKRLATMVAQKKICFCLSLYIGYAFLLFRDEVAVHRLVKNCVMEEGKLFMFVSSVTQTNKKVNAN